MRNHCNNRSKNLKLTLTLWAVGLFATNAYAAGNVVYGKDNRVDVYASTNSDFVELSKSTAGMVHHLNLDFIGGTGQYKLTGRSLGERMDLCKEEPFRDQKSSAICSGFLVGEDLLVTAGHCVNSEAKCINYRWVFNYKVSSADSPDVVVSNDDIYSCKKIIKTVYPGGRNDDYALIQLDRKVTVAEPVKFRTQGYPEKGTELVVIGHPSGLPTKIADGSTVRSINKLYFVADLDTYGGNSGSAVFNVKTGEVEGILVRGEQDYAWDSDANCRRSNYVGQTAGRGEDVTHITNVKALMNSVK